MPNVDLPKLIEVLGHLYEAHRIMEHAVYVALPDTARKKCPCGACCTAALPPWRYTRNPAWPCYPTSRDLDGKPQGYGCGVSLPAECLPGCPNVTELAKGWNEAHGIVCRVCTHCGMEVHHPPRAGCDGKQHVRHGKTCPCHPRRDKNRCGMCGVVLQTPYFGDGHGPDPKSLEEHEATCDFRKFWAQEYKKELPTKWTLPQELDPGPPSRPGRVKKGWV